MAIDIVAEILQREKGYVNNPADRGGATNFGITTQTYRWWTGDPNADVRNLTEEVARQILLDLYIKRPKIDLLPEKIRGFMADWSVHSGPILAIQRLQEALGVTVDGVIGPETLTAARLAQGEKLLRLLIASRLRMIARIVQKSPVQATFLFGWVDRALSFLD